MANKRIISIEEMRDFFSVAFNYDPETDKNVLVRALPENEKAEEILKNLWSIEREIQEELSVRAVTEKWPRDK